MLPPHPHPLPHPLLCPSRPCSYNVSSTLQRVRSEFVRMALDRTVDGLSDFEEALISGGTRVVDACEQPRRCHAALYVTPALVGGSALGLA